MLFTAAYFLVIMLSMGSQCAAVAVHAGSTVTAEKIDHHTDVTKDVNSVIPAEHEPSMNDGHVHKNRRIKHYHRQLPHILQDEMAFIERAALQKLHAGLLAPVQSRNHYRDVNVSIYVHPKMVHLSDGTGQERKYYAAVNAIAESGKDIVVYSAGNAGHTGFELEMAKLGASVFSFDCTVDDNPAWTTFAFRPWCIGGGNHSRLRPGEASAYVRGKDMANAKFYTLREIRRKLGHKRIDIFKFDIEGFEWDLIQHEIIEGMDDDLPEQLLFELHCEGSKKAYVPERLSKGKNRHAVNKLLIDLHNRNYRVMNFELNKGDKNAAEFAMIRLPGPSRRVIKLGD